MPGKYIEPSTGLALDILHARVNADADGVNVVIAPAPAKTILVLSYVLTASAAGLVTIQDDAAAVLAELAIPANGAVVYPGPTPAFETALGKGLNILHPVALDTNGHLSYVLK